MADILEENVDDVRDRYLDHESKVIALNEHLHRGGRAELTFNVVGAAAYQRVLSLAAFVEIYPDAADFLVDPGNGASAADVGGIFPAFGPGTGGDGRKVPVTACTFELSPDEAKDVLCGTTSTLAACGSGPLKLAKVGLLMHGTDWKKYTANAQASIRGDPSGLFIENLDADGLKPGGEAGGRSLIQRGRSVLRALLELGEPGCAWSADDRPWVRTSLVFRGAFFTLSWKPVG